MDGSTAQLGVAGMVHYQYRFKKKFQGRSTQGGFHPAHLSIVRGELTFRRDGPTGKVLRTGSAVGCKIKPPKKKRKGHEHAFRVNLAQSDSKKCSKYVISVPDEDELARWMGIFGAFAAMAQADVEAAVQQNQQNAAEAESSDEEDEDAEGEGSSDEEEDEAIPESVPPSAAMMSTTTSLEQLETSMVELREESHIQALKAEVARLAEADEARKVAEKQAMASMKQLAEMRFDLDTARAQLRAKEQKTQEKTATPGVGLSAADGVSTFALLFHGVAHGIPQPQLEAALAAGPDGGAAAQAALQALLLERLAEPEPEPQPQPISLSEFAHQQRTAPEEPEAEPEPETTSK